MIGIDEVGRGPWAGPVVAAAVRLLHPVAGLNDSKKLTEKRRNELNVSILETADCGIGWAGVTEIDRHGLSWAVDMAMRRAIEQVKPETNEQIIIDGNVRYLAEYTNVQCEVGADGRIDAVSAASIIAKVARDAYMVQLDTKSNGTYHFAQHKGYGTALHKQQIEIYGVSEHHRKSFKPIARYL